jgi:hypothetical protein
MITLRPKASHWAGAMTLLCVLPPLHAAAEPAQKCTKTSEALIARQFDRWNLAVASGKSIAASCNAASDTGTYAYRLTGNRKGTRTVATGRYSTFYEYRDGDWVIVRHHAQPAPAASVGLASR